MILGAETSFNDRNADAFYWQLERPVVRCQKRRVV
ncbi:hypothetical protein SAMN05216352_1135 [Alteribacillus bidgolensis]|uniref:Uncharacterized protein n=1 Tax=Alteribacillus bidgolensis TaxID=930129 RepID=A0A1G8NVC1_9BACI|nr:hypothetical protein SAMN05216352_1135 [Alteribacillus bidgolensis]